MKDKSKRRRSLAKALSWESFSFVLTVLIIWALTGDLKFTLELSVICQGAKIFFFFLHERVWHKIKWGKEQADTKEQRLQHDLDQLRSDIVGYRVDLLLDKTLTLETLDPVLRHLDSTICRGW